MKTYISSIKYNNPNNTNDYPYNICSLKNIEEIELKRPVTFFVGENGVGKSTLIEAIAIAYGFNREGGTKNFIFETENNNSNLYKNIVLKKTTNSAKDGFFLRAESFYNIATNIDELDKIPSASPKIICSYGGKSLHQQSHGESFLSLIKYRFRGNGLYILDEPESALSIEKQLSLLCRINELVKNNSQFIIATHSPIIMAYPNATIYSIEEDGIKETTYEETKQYIELKCFANNYKTIILELLNGE